MFLWLSLAFLAAAVAVFLLRPPTRSVAATPDNPDAAVYRDQLAELSAEVERGVITAEEAASARAEIARRLLRVADGETAARVAGSGSADGRAILFASATAIPLASLCVYLVIGSPGLPSRPQSERIAAPIERSQTDDLVAKVEQRLRENPNDGMGWSVIAPVYMAQGRLVEAGQAYERAIALLGETPDRLAGLAKALVLANNGIVVDPARKAFQRILALEPGRAEAQFWLAVAEEQNGRPAAAEAAYRKMLAEAPADAPWRQAVETRLAAIAGKDQTPPLKPSSAAPSVPAVTPAREPSAPPPVMAPPVLSSAQGGSRQGPSPAEFVAAAEKMPAELRAQMIGRMVEKATAAVASTPSDAAAWSRLVTGLKALGNVGEASAALKRARESLSGDRAALAELDALAQSLGLAS